MGNTGDCTPEQLVTIVDVTILYFIPTAAVDVLFLRLVFSCIKNYSNQKSADLAIFMSNKIKPFHSFHCSRGRHYQRLV